MAMKINDFVIITYPANTSERRILNIPEEFKLIVFPVGKQKIPSKTKYIKIMQIFCILKESIE